MTRQYRVASADSKALAARERRRDGGMTGRLVVKGARTVCIPQYQSRPHVSVCIALRECDRIGWLRVFRGKRPGIFGLRDCSPELRQPPEPSRWTRLPRHCVRPSLIQFSCVSGWKDHAVAGLCRTVFREYHGKRYVWQNALIVFDCHNTVTFCLFIVNSKLLHSFTSHRVFLSFIRLPRISFVIPHYPQESSVFDYLRFGLFDFFDTPTLLILHALHGFLFSHLTTTTVDQRTYY